MDAKSLQLWLVPPPVLCPSVSPQHISVIPGFNFIENNRRVPKSTEGSGGDNDKKRKVEHTPFNGFNNKQGKVDNNVSTIQNTQVKMEFQTGCSEQPTFMGMQTNGGNKLAGPELSSKKESADMAALVSSSIGVRTVCNTCGKWFRSRQQLTQHMLVHTDVRKYKCAYCGRAFKQPSHLQQHHRIHTGEKPYRCTMPGCSRAFPQLSNLNHHLRNHDKPDPPSENTCTICDRTYASETVLKNHLIKIHMIPTDCVGKCTPESKNKKEKTSPDDQAKTGGDLSENMLQMFTSAILSPPTSGAPVPTPIFPMMLHSSDPKKAIPTSESISTSKICSSFQSKSLELPFPSNMGAFGIDAFASFPPSPKFNNNTSRAKELQTLAINYRRRAEKESHHETDKEPENNNGYINPNAANIQYDHTAKKAIFNKIPLMKIKESMTNSRWSDSPRKVSKEELSQHFCRYNSSNEFKMNWDSEQKTDDQLQENFNKFDCTDRTNTSPRKEDAGDSTADNCNFEYATQYRYTLDGVTDAPGSNIKPDKPETIKVSFRNTQDTISNVKTEIEGSALLKDKHLAYEELRREYNNALTHSDKSVIDQIEEPSVIDKKYSAAYRVHFVPNSESGFRNDNNFQVNGTSEHSESGFNLSEKLDRLDEFRGCYDSEPSSTMKADAPVSHNSRKRKSFNPQRVVCVDNTDEAGILIN